jgi:hypothetical protein
MVKSRSNDIDAADRLLIYAQVQGVEARSWGDIRQLPRFAVHRVEMAGAVVFHIRIDRAAPCR